MVTKQTATSKKSKKIPQQPPVAITEQQRHEMIAEVAYRHALNRGFTKGSCEEDWYIAEAQIDAMLGGKKPH